MVKVLHYAYVIILSIIGAGLFFGAYAFADYYRLYEQAPHVHVQDGNLTQTGTDSVGNIKYLLSWTIHVSDDECVESVEYYKGGRWRDITPFASCAEEYTYGFGYGGALPPGDHYYYVRATDDAGNYAVVKVPFTLGG